MQTETYWEIHQSTNEPARRMQNHMTVLASRIMGSMMVSSSIMR
jgi:hypothetical protein